MSLRVSAIIPVYNAAPYVREAVESALIQPECSEVVLVEDGSSDDSLQICQQLAAEHHQVKLYQHPGGINKGAGPTRNLAIEKASCDLIAFLDADDFFAPDHLAVACRVLQADPTLDGVYGAAAWHYDDDAARERHQEIVPGIAPLYTMAQRVPPEYLFVKLAKEHVLFTIISVVCKKSAALKTGGFNELRLAQDRVFTMKLSAVARLAPGELERPVVMIRVHPQNRSIQPTKAADLYKRRMDYAKALLQWGNKNLPATQQQHLIDLYVRYHTLLSPIGRDYPDWLNPVVRRLRLVGALRSVPEYVDRRMLWRSIWHYLLPGRWRRR